MTTATLPALLQGFFTGRLAGQLQASPNTIASYRDTFRLLLQFANERLGRPPTQLRVEDLRPSFLGEFLEYLEAKRGNSARSRNTRLAAVRSFFRYVALQEPAHGLQCQRVLAMPNKRHVRRSVAYLDREEVDALLAAPDVATWVGRRDRSFLLVAVQTGLRVSELIGLRRQDVVLGQGGYVRCEGKGRKERSTPLRRDAARSLERWLRERGGGPEDLVFTTIRGGRLSRDAIERLVKAHAARASERRPSLKRKRVTPHVLRHSAAMDLLQNGVDRTVIALWLGHESVETTQMYLQADLRMKERALARTTPASATPGRYRPGDELLAFLEAL